MIYYKITIRNKRLFLQPLSELKRRLWEKICPSTPEAGATEESIETANRESEGESPVPLENSRSNETEV